MRIKIKYTLSQQTLLQLSPKLSKTWFMNSETPYSETMQSFLSSWQSESHETFNYVRQTVHSMEDSFHSASSHNTSLERISAVRISAEAKSLNSETFENQSLSTSFGITLFLIVLTPLRFHRELQPKPFFLRSYSTEQRYWQRTS